jgi:SnoaL-like domain
VPTRQALAAFIAQVVSGDHVGAIADWYAPDAWMQENQAEQRRGRETLMASEAKVLARMERVETELVAPPLVDGDRVVIRWRFVFTPKIGSRTTMEEVAWQTWSGDKIVTETFFYDPAQMTA